MKSLKATILLLATLSAVTVQAAPYKEVVCESPRMKDAIRITPNSLSFVEKEGVSRKIAQSIDGVLTRGTQLGFTKEFKFEGKSHIVSVKDVTSPSELDDTIIIRNQKGHEILYPLSCKIAG